jgi:hypothetical protein
MKACDNMKWLNKVMTSVFSNRGNQAKTPHEEMCEALKPKRERKIPAPPASAAKVKRIK